MLGLKKLINLSSNPLLTPYMDGWQVYRKCDLSYTCINICHFYTVFNRFKV